MKHAPADRPAADDWLADALVTASFVVMAATNRIGAEHDLSLSLVRVLGILWDHRPRMSELADHLGLEKQTMSGLIARREARPRGAGEERGRPPGDGRVPDRRGGRLAARLHDRIRRELAPAMDRLDAADRQHLQGLLMRLLDHPGR